MDGKSNGTAYYVMKNKKPHIVGIDMDGTPVMRHQTISMSSLEPVNEETSLLEIAKAGRVIAVEGRKGGIVTEKLDPVSFSLSEPISAAVSEITYETTVFPTSPEIPPSILGQSYKIAAEKRENALYLGEIGTN